ncbi:MAG: hypothetical protein J0L57_10385 [Burkholderiales bacterium]|nr:hypothetical protein [Burkholderiales bacterium]
MAQVATGQVVIRQRLVVEADASWNQFEFAPDDFITPTRTQHGITVDALKFHAGLKNDALVALSRRDPSVVHPLAFEAWMQPADVVALFAKLHSRGGSTFTLEKVEPAPFVGASGWRFEFSRSASPTTCG